MVERVRVGRRVGKRCRQGHPRRLRKRLRQPAPPLRQLVQSSLSRLRERAKVRDRARPRILAIPQPGGTVRMAKVSMSTQLPVAARTVWDSIGGFNSLARWHPAVAKSEEAKKGGATIRTLTLHGGGKIVEQLDS